MKADRRHELAHNDLADRLALWGEKSQPYARAALLAVVGLAVVIFAWSYLHARAESQSAAAWDEYYLAMNSRDMGQLQEISEKYVGTPVAEISSVVRADLLLAEGVSKLFTEKANGRDTIEKAADAYATVAKTARDESLLERALFGLARCHESLSDSGEVDTARQEYEKLIKTYPDGMYAVAAKKRLDDLNRDTTKRFYDWFAKYEPRPRTSGIVPPLGTSPAAQDEFFKQSPDGPLNLPNELSPTKKPASGGGAVGDSVVPDLLEGLTNPPKNAAPASEAPAAEAPAAEAPVSEPAPAAEATPPAEPPATESK